MSNSSVFWPVLAQVFLTLVMFILMGARKSRAVKAGQVDRQATALDNRKWPEEVVKVSNNIANQFEVPVLFYVLCLVLYSLDAVGVVALVLAWLFALSRYAHAVAHVGANYVPVRMRLFIVGVVAVLGLFVLAVRAMVLA